MKPLFLISLPAVLVALFLPLLCLPSASSGDRPPETAGSAETEDSAAVQVPPDAARLRSDAETRFTCLENGELLEVSMAEYLPGVLAGEMPASFEPEALKAQAVAARSYILCRIASPPAAHPEAAVCGKHDCCLSHLPEQSLRENWAARYAEYMEKICRAVTETDGHLLLYEGQPVQAVFHASSAGFTEASGALWSPLPYLVSVESPETAGTVPNYITTVELSPSDFRAALEDFSPDITWPEDPTDWLGEQQRGESGRVESVVIGGAEFPGTALRSLFSLRSTCFTLEYTEGRFLFTVTGSGHGVGMSQYGANVMAANGADFTAILAHYYPGAVLSSG